MASLYKNELGESFPRFVFIWKFHIIFEKSDDFKSHKTSLVGPDNLKICILA